MHRPKTGAEPWSQVEKSSLAHLCAHIVVRFHTQVEVVSDWRWGRTSGGIQDPGEPERVEERPLKGKGQGRVVLRFLLLSLNVARFVFVLEVRRRRAGLECIQTLLVVIISRGVISIDSPGVVLFVIKKS